jgi:carbamoylphosphate synthase large subunit
MTKHTIWFNKSSANIVNVADGLRAADTDNQLRVIVSHPVKDLYVALPWCEFHREPDVAGAAYLEWALAFCRDNGVTVFVCGKQAGYLADYRAQFAQAGTQLLVAVSSENFAILDDKDRAYQALINGGAAEIVPPYEVASTAQEFAQSLENLAPQGKLCFKPTVSIFGIGFRIITDETEKTGLDRLLSGDVTYISKTELATLMAEKPSFKPLMVMSYLADNERSIDCVAHEGKVVACVIRRKVAQGQVLEDNPLLVSYVRRLVEIFGLDNFFNAQFREKDGKYYLLEINPRMSGGTHYTFHSGLNLPYLGVMLKLGLMSPADIPANIMDVRVYPVEGAVSAPVSMNRAPSEAA